MAEFNKRKAEIEKLAAATRDQQEDVEVRRAGIDAKKARSRGSIPALNPKPYPPPQILPSTLVTVIEPLSQAA